jgi:hypothetical protein
VTAVKLGSCTSSALVATKCERKIAGKNNLIEYSMMETVIMIVWVILSQLVFED